MFGIFELTGQATKVRVFAEHSFASLDDAISFFRNGFTVVDSELEPDGSAADIAVSHGSDLNVYAIERL